MKPCKIYSDSIDGQALDQFYKAMKNEHTVKGALMPDAHKGYTLPIGAVVATKDYIYPSFVGYDIGCTDSETEYLTINGWKKIKQYNGEAIMVYNKELNQCELQKPLKYIVKDCEYFNYLDNGVVNQMLSNEHTVLLFSQRGIPKTKYIVDWLKNNNKLNKGVSDTFKTIIPLKDKMAIDYTDNELRLIIAVSADGCIRKDGRIEFHLIKERKINRLLCLLEKNGIKPVIYNRNNDNFNCSFRFSKATKYLSLLWAANKQQLRIVVDEVFLWDGHIAKDGQRIFSSCVKENVDVIQYALAVNGIRANWHKTTYEQKKNWRSGYQLYTTNNSNVYFPKPKDIYKVKSNDRSSYCFTTSTGFWVMRRKGKIVITGNCGMCAVKTTFQLEAVRINAELIMAQIYSDLPVGFNHHQKKVKTNFTTHGLTNDGRVIAEHKKMFRQLGTLGGGNHFVEIGKDEPNDVWIIVHSGSRGVGHGIAQHYMRKASPNGKASEGHYGFHVGTVEGQNYIADLGWALSYALLNRRHILDIVISAMNKYVVGIDIQKTFINRNHNHAELKDGLWIHRKGATHAEKGMMGVIPGNMRDGSFIVEGKGNLESLCSSSHGAGRVLGRRVAKETLSYKEFADGMKGITARTTVDMLDESPMAYKNIFEVMDLQKDLADVKYRIKPIINIKG